VSGAVRLSVPGNMLLLGEYAVLEEGGIGLAMAVERRVRAASAPAPALRVEGTWPGGAAAWSADRPGGSPLVSAAVTTVAQWIGGDASLPRARISVDSAAFFMPGGRKAGLGSSAAVAVALTCALLEAAGRRDAVRDGTACRLSILAHRRSQGGAGSGYDAACSFNGGLGIFRGGAEPRWEPCPLSWRPVVSLFPGPAAVSTADAVRRYAEWKARSPRAARDFLEESNRRVLAFIGARSASEAMQALAECARLGIALGQSIGVPAGIAAPAGVDAGWCKTVGAGNELGMCMLPANAHPPEAPGLFPAPLAERGVTWEE
jgi:phosphomevalonate kinase